MAARSQPASFQMTEFKLPNFEDWGRVVVWLTCVTELILQYIIR